MTGFYKIDYSQDGHPIVNSEGRAMDKKKILEELNADLYDAAEYSRCGKLIGEIKFNFDELVSKADDDGVCDVVVNRADYEVMLDLLGNDT